MKTKHGIDLPVTQHHTQIPCQFPDCTSLFKHKSKMFAHMTEVHGCVLSKEFHEFDTYHEFTEWKQRVEVENHLFFSKQSGVRIGIKRPMEEREIFYCQFDGSAKPHHKQTVGNTRRGPNKKGKSKGSSTLTVIQRYQYIDENITGV